MNNDRRGRLEDVVDMLNDINDEIDDIVSEEQDAYYSLPDSLQESSKGDKMMEYVDLMEIAMDKITNVQDFIMQEIIKKR